MSLLLKQIRIFFLLAISSGILSGCGSLLKAVVDPAVQSAYPPVSIAEKQAAAIEEASKNLQLLKEPGLLLNVEPKEVSAIFKELIKNVQDSQITLESASVMPTQQAFRFYAEIHGNLEEKGIEFDARLSGDAIVSIRSSTSAFFGQKPSQVAVIRPALTAAELTGLHLKNVQFASKPIEAAINAALGRYLDNINGAIKDIEFKIDPTKIGLSPTAIDISIGANKNIIIPGINLGATAVLVDDNGLHLMSEIEVRPLLVAPMDITSEFDKYRSNFLNLAKTVYEGKNINETGLFLSDAVLKRILAPGFPPLPLSDLQTLALNELQQSLASVRVVAMGMYLNPDSMKGELEKMLNVALRENSSSELSFGSVAIRFEQQSVVVDVPVTGAIGAPGEQIRYSAVASLAGLVRQRGGALHYRLAMAGLTLNRVEQGGLVINPKPFLVTINRLLDQLVPYVNAFSDDVPISFSMPDLQSFSFNSDDIKVDPPQLKAPPSKPFLLYPRLDQRGLRIIVSEAEKAVEPTFSTEEMLLNHSKAKDQTLSSAFSTQNRLLFFSTTPPIPPNSASVDQIFDGLWMRSNFPSYNSDIQAAGAVSLPWFTGKLGAMLTDNRIKLTKSFDEKAIVPSIPIKPFPRVKSGCVVDPPYNRAACGRNGCSRDGCNWNCETCWSVGPYHDCKTDPICESGKLACNVREEASVLACNIREEGQVAACNAAEETKVAADNIKRTLQTSVCDLTQELVNGINGLTNLGDIGGDTQVTGAFIVSDPNMRYDETTSALKLNMNARFDVRASGTLDYTAKGLGHVLICPFSGQVSYVVNATGELSGGGIGASISPIQSNQSNDLALRMKFDPLRVTGMIDPPPLEALLVQNPQIQVLCSPIMNAVVDTAAILGKISAFTSADFITAIEQAIPNFPPEAKSVIDLATKGKVDKLIDLPEIKVQLPPVPFSMGAKKFILRPQWSVGSISLIVN